MGKLEKATYICLITVSLLSFCLIVENRFFHPPPPGQPTERALIGQQEKSISAAVWKGSKKNVVLLLSTKCHFCSESAPLYQRLAEIRQRTPQGISLVVASLDQPEPMRDYLSAKKIAVDNILHVSSGFVGVSATPTIFLVDSDGIIRKVYFGKLDWFGEKKLLDAIASADF